MTRHRVAVLGCGPRGDDHLHGFAAHPDRFEVVGLCDRDADRIETLAAKYAIKATFTDAAEMFRAVEPEVFCFATMPDLRWPLIELALEHGVQAIAFEKPMALTLKEARRIRDACIQAKVKAVVSHQQKYGAHYQAVKDIVDGGRIGDVHTIQATSQAWLMQLGTHMIDYALWLNGRSLGEWVIGQVHGKGHLTDSHPSPDYACGRVAFANGVCGVFEFGHLSPSFLPKDMFWVDDTLTAYGTHGYARVIVGGGWQAYTKDSNGTVLTGEGMFDPKEEQPIYMRDLADWLDGLIDTHPCDIEISYHGFELAMGLCWSALQQRALRVPFDALPEEPLFEQLARELP